MIADLYREITAAREAWASLGETERTVAIAAAHSFRESVYNIAISRDLPDVRVGDVSVAKGWLRWDEFVRSGKIDDLWAVAQALLDPASKCVGERTHI